MKNLKYIRFYDEVFPDDPAWLDEFLPKYTRHINLPFECWGHSMRTDPAVFKRLRKAGLYKISMGVQSGSHYIRRQIFNRPESHEQIIQASQTLADAKIPEVYWDLMVRHPFETHDTLRETLEMCLQLKGSFELQIHGLNFLPGTPIVQKAIDLGLVSPQEMDELINSPMSKQFEMHWRYDVGDETMNYIYKLMYLSQLKWYKRRVRKLAPASAPMRPAKVNRMYARGQKLVRLRHIYKKLKLLSKGHLRAIFNR